MQCWGLAASGQLGNGVSGSGATQLVPVAVTGVTSAVAVSAGGGHTCAVLTGGAVQCWGFNRQGQAGATNTTNQTLPATVAGTATVASASAGYSHTCAVLQNGGAQCWGSLSYGQLGNALKGFEATPVAILGSGAYQSVSVGPTHSCGLLLTGGVQCWGDGALGRLGNGSVANQATPVAVTGISAAIEIGVGDAHACAVLASGSVQCWGYGDEGELGIGIVGTQATPVTVIGISTAKSVAAGRAFTCVVLASGSVQCWGRGTSGQLGNGAFTNQTSPVTVSGISDAVAISAGEVYDGQGGQHVCAVLSGGGIKCWGRGTEGQLGNGGMADQASPVVVSGISTASAVSVGAAHSCAVLRQGGFVFPPITSAACWGMGAYGLLGSGGTANQLTPVTVSGLVKPVAIAAGKFHTCAVQFDSTVRCWGNGTSGQLGDGSQSSTQLTPVPAYGISSAIGSISAGEYHTCSVVAGGAIRCWGANDQGQLGNGTGVPQRATPQYVDSTRCDLDLDGNGSYALTTDVLLYARALAGLSGNAVTAGAVGAGATRTTWPQIREYLTQVCGAKNLAP